MLHLAFFLLIFIQVECSWHYRRLPKVMLFGEANTGKTCLANRLSKAIFQSDSAATIGADYFRVEYGVNGEKVVFDLWDTAGQEKYSSMLSFYYREADVALIVYDITSQSSLAYLLFTIDKLSSYNDRSLDIILVANKADRLESADIFLVEKAKQFAQAARLPHIQVSALTGEGIDDLMLAIGKCLLPKASAEKIYGDGGDQVNIYLQVDEDYMRKKRDSLLDDDCCS